MSDLLKALQQRHREKLDQLQRGQVDEAFWDGAQLLAADLRQAGASVADPAGRGQLRALIRFWGSVIYEHTGVYPDTMLFPLDPERAAPLPQEPSRHPFPPLIWMLVGGAAALVLALGLVAVGRLAGPEKPSPTATALPFVSHVAVGAGLGADGELLSPGDTFCAGVSQVAAEFELAGLDPGTEWRWEVQRAGETIAGQQPVPWGDEARQSVILLPGGAAGVEPGRYELLVYVPEQVVGVHSFLVLDAAPRVFGLRVADVPAPAEEDYASQFTGDIRALYVGYEYEGLCPGLNVSHVLYRAEEPVQRDVALWNTVPRGTAQAAFQAAAGAPFPSGDYEVVVMVEGQEQASVGFTIGEPAPEEQAPSPAIGGITVALGVQPDGTPIVTAPDNVFDWNTKVIYAIFDYVGMRGGLRWSAVWMRNGEAVARQEHFWDVEADGAEGTRWAAYYDDLGRVLPGGNYSVTLYIDDVAQSTADFRLLYYVPK